MNEHDGADGFLVFAIVIAIGLAAAVAHLLLARRRSLPRARAREIRKR